MSCTALPQYTTRTNPSFPLQEKALRRMATLPKKMLPLRLQVFKQFLLRTNLLTPARKAAAVGAGVQLAPPSRECLDMGCVLQAVGGRGCSFATWRLFSQGCLSSWRLRPQGWELFMLGAVCSELTGVSCPWHLSSRAAFGQQLTPCSHETFSSDCQVFLCWHWSCLLWARLSHL